MSFLFTKLAQVLSALQGNCVRVLAYHSISDSPADPFSVSPDEFRSQMDFLRLHRYGVISANTLAQIVQHGENLSRKVVITFDDAYSDFYTHALPVLADFHYSATVFIPTAFIGKMSTWSKISPSRLVMNTTQLEQASAKGIELGSHTLNHASLLDLSQTDLADELAKSKESIHQLTGQAKIPLAYPFGMAGAREQAATKLSGYTSGFMADGLWGCCRGSDLYALPREMVKRNLSIAEFSRRISGQADFQRLLGSLNHNSHPRTKYTRQSAGPGAGLG